MARKPTAKPSVPRVPKGEPSESRAVDLVIVESPAKAKTIEKYLGPGFVVRASVGHIRDLPSKSPKGVKQPVPGIDLNSFEPTYVIHEGKSSTVSELRRLAKSARTVWFATDLDREGEAIAWHLAMVLGIPPDEAKRVTFDAVTKADVREAFAHPHAINMDRVNAQQARRLLDRIVGYLVSPVLWKKVAGGLSAGRVQSPATRLIVLREREIAAFTPDESWEIHATMTLSPSESPSLAKAWEEFNSRRDERGRGPLVRERMAWLSQHGSIECEMVEAHGKPFKVEALRDSSADLTLGAVAAAEAAGLLEVCAERTEDPSARGRGRRTVKLVGHLDPKARYRVASVDTTRTRSKPYPPFITSTLQQAASGRLGFSTDRAMRVAQGLYEGVDVPGEGRVGLITYMRTDSTHLSTEAVTNARTFIASHYGAKYLPDTPRQYSSSNKAAQEAHEAIRPTDPSRTPESLARSLTEEQLKLYTLVWRSFVACQMVDAEWDATAVRLVRSDTPTGACFKANGRVLVFDGCYRASGIPGSDSEQTLPAVKVDSIAAPFSIEPEQKFSSPPPRYTEATLVKTLESAGIGRPSTYASIIRTIQDREYVEQVDRRFHATDLGMAVNDFLVEGFSSNFVEIDYTKRIEEELDEIAQGKEDWRTMLRQTTRILEPLIQRAMALPHAKSVLDPAPYACPVCGARTEYRLGKSGRFLSCSAYPACKFANPVDREGRPLVPEKLDLLSPNGVPMVKRHGRFGEFLVEDLPRTPAPARRTRAKKGETAAPKLKATKHLILNIDRKGGIKFPAAPALLTELPCPKCGAMMNLRDGKRGPWLGCSAFPRCRGRESFGKLDEAHRKSLEVQLTTQLAGHTRVVVTRRDGTPVAEGTPVEALALPDGVATLALHPDFVAQQARSATAH